MTDSDPLVRQVIDIIADKGGKPPETIGLDTTFEELGFDSLDGINILFALEDTFSVSIPDTIAQEITSIRMAVEKLRPLVEGAAG
ncbi:MAG TPA: acyl carrier protein [Thermoanaerobaculia bacterium]|nr:acyl carrier protein [Thermoanaerobaculia bacterium]